MRLNFRLIKQDFKTAVPVLAIVVVVIVIANVVLGKICPTRMLFGIPCPGCGITRAFLLVLQGKFYEATVMHSFWILLTLLLLVFLAVRYLVQSEETSKKLMKILKICFIVILMLGIVYYIYRMVMWYPDRAPMVYDADNMFEKIRSQR